MLHWPVCPKTVANPKQTLEETWRALELLLESDRCRSIGVSNFQVGEFFKIKYLSLKMVWSTRFYILSFWWNLNRPKLLLQQLLIEWMMIHVCLDLQQKDNSEFRVVQTHFPLSVMVKLNDILTKFCCVRTSFDKRQFFACRNRTFWILWRMQALSPTSTSANTILTRIQKNFANSVPKME